MSAYWEKSGAASASGTGAAPDGGTFDPGWRSRPACWEEGSAFLSITTASSDPTLSARKGRMCRTCSSSEAASSATFTALRGGAATYEARKRTISSPPASKYPDPGSGGSLNAASEPMMERDSPAEKVLRPIR